ncbi:MAG: 3-dehydroquinate synthase [Bacteroidales bacterium]|nr:3-dehydroquinate synthase [Bacteroidales bacterium]
MTKELGISVQRSQKSRIMYGETLAGLDALLEGEKEVFVVYDRNVEWAAEEIRRSSRRMTETASQRMMGIDASEQAKSMDTVLGICRWLLDVGASRQALVLAVGGGITSDLVGFAASIYKRGIRYANVPTTLLAQVDAAIGGKTGVNLDGYKNMIGAIVQPEFTFICPEPLRTLPQREFKSGLAEMLKTFLIADANAYRQALGGVNGELILRAAAIKAEIVQKDPFEKGERAKLNLGHTFAHAIEHEARVKGADITHGEAVAIGIIMAAEMAEREGVAEKGLEQALRADFQSLGLPTECPFGDMEEAMKKDKKVKDGRVKFVLPVAVGNVIIRFAGQAGE